MNKELESSQEHPAETEVGIGRKVFNGVLRGSLNRRQTFLFMVHPEKVAEVWSKKFDLDKIILERYILHATVCALIVRNLREGKISEELGLRILNTNPTFPELIKVDPSSPEHLDPHPPEYYVGDRGSRYPVLPPSLQTTASQNDFRPPGYHTGGPGPYMPPQFRIKKG